MMEEVGRQAAVQDGEHQQPHKTTEANIIYIWVPGPFTDSKFPTSFQTL